MAQVTWDRRFRTTQERRANQPDEDGWWCRPKRRPHRIPCSYWDLPRRTQRCWKAQRNTQHAYASRALAKCQDSPQALALRERSAARRAAKAVELRQKRGLTTGILKHSIKGIRPQKTSH